jgi:K+-sensing histidine kinase KdpD
MPEIETESFRRAIVALNGGPSDARIVRLVASYAAKAKSELIAVHVVEIDWTLPLDADIAGRSEEVQQVLDSAEAIAESYRLTMEPVLLQARDVGAAIVDEATERGVDPSSSACRIASASGGSSRSAGPSRMSCRMRRAPSGWCASR